MAPENSNWLSFSLSSMDNPADSDSCYSFSDNFYAAEAAAYMQQPPPKLEDFFAGGGGDSAGTQDSSLTNMYFGDEHHQDLKAVFGAGPFSATSASEVDDSTFSVRRNLSPAGTGNFNSTETTLAVAAPDSESCKKTGDTFSQRTSIYRGVTRHRWTGRYEAHLWDNSCRREGQARKGRQVYLGGYDKEDKAAHAYDLAALKYWGPTATTNFPLESYSKEIEAMANVTKQEFIASLRRKSSGFSRGASIYRGVTRHHQQGKWQARIGRVAGNKDLYLGTFGTEEEAAEAYDIAAIKFRGLNAVTNFEMSRYDIEAIANSPLPVGGTSKRSKPSREAQEKPTTTAALQTTSFSFASNQPAPPVPISCGVPLDSFTPFGNYHHLYNPAAASDASTVNEFFVWPHQSY